jgi:hypothetical protein
MSEIIVSYAVSYVCQFTSPDLVADFIYERRPLEADPRWREYGAQSLEEYAHRSRRSCVVVCVKMAVEAITRQEAKPIMEWVQAGLLVGGYLTEIREDRPVEKGWKHASLAEMAGRNSCSAKLISESAIADLAEYIRSDRLIIASVSSELGEAGPITRNSGHLVVVYAVEVNDHGGVTHIRLHNPSGRSPQLQASALLAPPDYRGTHQGGGSQSHDAAWHAR